MPLSKVSAGGRAAMSAVDVDGSLDSLAIVPFGARLKDSSWNDFQTVLRQDDDSPGIVVVFGDHWFTKLFAEVWNVLPKRLASLAIRPPATSHLVLPHGFEPSTLTHQSPTDSTDSHLHWSLVRIAKGESRLVVRNVPIEWASAEARDQAAALDEQCLPELLATPPHRELNWLFSELRLARLSDLCGAVVSPADATAVQAGLWLLHGDADESHRCSQSIEDEGRHRCGNFWHAIMHRQEPDYGNSKYWFRRVGQHPILPELARRADEFVLASELPNALAQRPKLGLPHRWDTFAFVDWCESAVRTGDAEELALLRRIQFIEMHLLLRASFNDAVRP